MSGHQQTVRHSKNTEYSFFWNTFLVNFIKNISNELKSIVEGLRFVIMYIGGLFLFLIEFKVVQGVLGIIIPPVIIGLSVMYLTLLPSYLVVPLVLLPKKFTMPIVGLSVLFSFFIVFLI